MPGPSVPTPPVPPLQTQVGLDFFPEDGLFTSLDGFLSFCVCTLAE